MKGITTRLSTNFKTRLFLSSDLFLSTKLAPSFVLFYVTGKYVIEENLCRTSNRNIGFLASLSLIKCTWSLSLCGPKSSARTTKPILFKFNQNPVIRIRTEAREDLSTNLVNQSPFLSSSFSVNFSKHTLSLNLKLGFKSENYYNTMQIGI